MTSEIPVETASIQASGTIRYVTPFLVFMALLALAPYWGLPEKWELPLRFGVLAVVCWMCWPKEIPLRPRVPMFSVLVGLAVFVIWIAPDLLYSGYRALPLFSNKLFGHPHSTLPAAALRDPSILFWRTARAALIVPIVEELFWRGWMMRWLIDARFQRVRLGTYAAAAFWITALLFASEHGPYWDVGLLAGIAYNWWLIRTKSLADCMLAHGVTNLVLSAWVIAAGQWQYWQ